MFNPAFNKLKTKRFKESRERQKKATAAFYEKKRLLCDKCFIKTLSLEDVKANYEEILERIGNCMEKEQKRETARALRSAGRRMEELYPRDKNDVTCGQALGLYSVASTLLNDVDGVKYRTLTDLKNHVLEIRSKYEYLIAHYGELVVGMTESIRIIEDLMKEENDGKGFESKS